VVDGLKGFPEAIASVYTQTVVQPCIVHLTRNSLAFVSWKDRKAILPAIKAIYRVENADMALIRLEAREGEWGKRYPAIGQACGECGACRTVLRIRPGDPKDDLHRSLR
jgi:putative transposase